MIAFSALADPTRLHIVEMLAENGRLPASHISMRFTISPPAVSQHLKALKKANLVKVETSAQQRIYSLNPEGLAEIEHWSGKFRRMWEARFGALDELLKAEVKKARKKGK